MSKRVAIEDLPLNIRIVYNLYGYQQGTTVEVGPGLNGFYIILPDGRQYPLSEKNYESILNNPTNSRRRGKDDCGSRCSPHNRRHPYN
ncbi:MAG: hypothetical protein QXY45_02945 [Candidatus Aenigmatarchaeota archaeon]